MLKLVLISTLIYLILGIPTENQYSCELSTDDENNQYLFTVQYEHIDNSSMNFPYMYCVPQTADNIQQLEASVNGWVLQTTDEYTQTYQASVQFNDLVACFPQPRQGAINVITNFTIQGSTSNNTSCTTKIRTTDLGSSVAIYGSHGVNFTTILLSTSKMDLTTVVFSFKTCFILQAQGDYMLPLYSYPLDSTGSVLMWETTHPQCAITNGICCQTWSAALGNVDPQATYFAEYTKYTLISSSTSNGTNYDAYLYLYTEASSDAELMVDETAVNLGEPKSIMLQSGASNCTNGTIEIISTQVISSTGTSYVTLNTSTDPNCPSNVWITVNDQIFGLNKFPQTVVTLRITYVSTASFSLIQRPSSMDVNFTLTCPPNTSWNGLACSSATTTIILAVCIPLGTLMFIILLGVTIHVLTKGVVHN